MSQICYIASHFVLNISVYRYSYLSITNTLLTSSSEIGRIWYHVITIVLQHDEQMNTQKEGQTGGRTDGWRRAIIFRVGGRTNAKSDERKGDSERKKSSARTHWYVLDMRTNERNETKRNSTLPASWKKARCTTTTEKKTNNAAKEAERRRRVPVCKQSSSTVSRASLTEPIPLLNVNHTLFSHVLAATSKPSLTCYLTNTYDRDELMVLPSEINEWVSSRNRTQHSNSFLHWWPVSHHFSEK